MSDAFRDREAGFEAKFQHDQELAFKVSAHRDRLFGKWVAGKLMLSGQPADDYAAEMVASNFSRPGDDDMIEKAMQDLSQAGFNFSKDVLIREIKTAETQAIRELGPPAT